MVLLVCFHQVNYKFHFCILRPRSLHLFLNPIFFVILTSNLLKFCLNFENILESDHVSSVPSLTPWAKALFPLWITAKCPNCSPGWHSCLLHYFLPAEVLLLSLFSGISLYSSKNKSSHQMHSPGSRYWMALNKWQNRRSNDITPPRLLFLRHVSSVNLKRAASRLLQAPLLHLSLWHWWFGENERKKLARETEISLCNRKCR